MSIVASPTFARRPARASTTTRGRSSRPASSAAAATSSTVDRPRRRRLIANDHYWAGKPAIKTIQLVHDIAGRSPVQAFEDGDRRPRERLRRSTRRGSPTTTTLGPQLRAGRVALDQRTTASTRRSRRSTTSGSARRSRRPSTGGGSCRSCRDGPPRRPATGMVPPGIPGRATRTSCPTHDPDGARALLAEAGYPGRQGLPGDDVHDFGGGPYDAGVRRGDQARARRRPQRRGPGRRLLRPARAGPAADLVDGLGRRLSGPERLPRHPARRPGVEQLRPLELAGVRRGHREGARGRRTRPPTRAAFDTAEGIVRDEAPVIPLSYDVDWTLARTGLLGAQENGLGITRMAGLAWAADDAAPGAVVRHRWPRSLVGRGLVRRCVVASPVAAADPVTFGHADGRPRRYGGRSTSSQPVDLATRPTRVELLLQTPGSSRAPASIDVDAADAGRARRRSTSASPLADGHIVPNTTFTARWRVDRRRRHRPGSGPPVTRDLRRRRGSTGRRSRATSSGSTGTEGGDGVRPAGPEDRRRRVAQTCGSSLGVTETEPIDFFIYADQDTFYDALGPAPARTSAARPMPTSGRCSPSSRRPRSTTSWVGIVVPHELTHLVFDTAVENPYHDPPHWLNEGLAVYLSRGLRVEPTASRSRRRRATARSCRSTASSARSRRAATASSSPTPRASSAVDWIVRDQRPRRARRT